MRLGVTVGVAFATVSLLVGGSSVEGRNVAKRRSKAPSLYDIKGLVDISGQPVDMSGFAGRVSLVVNVASA